jgi:hypothetical protein
LIDTTEATQPRGNEPWIGYDEQDATQIRRFLAKAGSDQARAVREYERAGLDRDDIVAAVDRRLNSRPA